MRSTDTSFDTLVVKANQNRASKADGMLHRGLQQLQKQNLSDDLKRSTMQKCGQALDVLMELVTCFLASLPDFRGLHAGARGNVRSEDSEASNYFCLRIAG